MPKFESNRVINGTWGEMWVNDMYLAEVEEGKAEIDLTYSDVSMVRTLTPGKKLTKIEPKGSVKLHHVRSNIAKEVSDSVQQGKSPTFKIIMKLEDPDAFGAERVALYGCKFDKAVLMDFAVGKNGEESYSFTFESWEWLDAITA